VTGDTFWVDYEHDRLVASDGVSRYGYYVRQRILGGFGECWDGTFETRLAERFAELAWRTATGPVMSPPYADWRAPVLSARLGLDSDGDSPGLIATVDIASPWVRAFGRGHVGGRSWWPWPRQDTPGRSDSPRNPYGDEVTSGGHYALASLRLVFPIPVQMLPAAPGPQHRRGEVEQTARQAVSILVTELNQVVGPVITTLEQRSE